LDILDCPTTGNEIFFCLSSPHPKSHVMYRASSFPVSTHGGSSQHQHSTRTDTGFVVHRFNIEGDRNTGGTEDNMLVY